MATPSFTRRGLLLGAGAAALVQPAAAKPLPRVPTPSGVTFTSLSDLSPLSNGTAGVTVGNNRWQPIKYRVDGGDIHEVNMPGFRTDKAWQASIVMQNRLQYIKGFFPGHKVEVSTDPNYGKARTYEWISDATKPASPSPRAVARAKGGPAPSA